MSKLYLIRHAQASFLAEDYDNLSDHGHQQAIALGQYLRDRHIEFDKVYVGPLKRQQQTGERIRAAYHEQGLPFPEMIKIEELREYEGMDSMNLVRPQLMEHYPVFRQLFEEMSQHPSHKTKMKLTVKYLDLWANDALAFDLPKGVQSFAEFRNIAELGLAKIIQGNKKGKTIAAISSGGCIAAILGKVLGIPHPGKTIGLNLVMLNTAISEVLFSTDRISLLNFNTLPHLQENMITTM